MSSLYMKPPPREGLYAIPPFSDQGTVVLSRFYIAPGFGPVTAELAFYARDLSQVGSSLWSVFGEVGHIFGGDAVVVPNGAEFWMLHAPAPPPDFALREHELFRVRWELHT